MTTPENLVHMLTSERPDNTLTFGDDELPTEGVAHNKALYLTVGCLKKDTNGLG